MKRQLVVAGATICALLALSACSASDSGSGSAGTATPRSLQFSETDVTDLGGQEAVDEMKALYDAAVESGKTTVTIYGATELDREPVYEVFEKRFPGIEVKAGFVPDLRSKLEQEFATGQLTIDLLQDGDASQSNLASQGRFENYTPVLAAALEPQYTDGEGFLASASAVGMGIAYNSDQVTSDDVPTEWHDLTDPKWKDQIVMFPADQPGPTSSTLSQMLWDGRFTMDFVEGLAANTPGAVDTVQAVGTKVASGEYDLGAVYAYSFYKRAIAEGDSPLKFIFPLADGNRFSPMYLGVLSGAPSPDAAKLLEAWMFTPEAQQTVTDVGLWGTMPDAPGVDDYPALKDADPLKAIPLDQVLTVNVQRLEEYKAIFG